MYSYFGDTTLGLWLQLGKENHVADVFLAQKHRAEAVDPHAHAAGGWHAVLERHEEIFVELLLLTTGLVFQAFALLDRIVLLGVSRRDFLPVNAALEDFNGRRIVGRQFAEGDKFFRQMRDKDRLNQFRLN